MLSLLFKYKANLNKVSYKFHVEFLLFNNKNFIDTGMLNSGKKQQHASIKHAFCRGQMSKNI